MSKCYQDLCREYQEYGDNLLIRFKFFFEALAVGSVIALLVYGYINAGIGNTL